VTQVQDGFFPFGEIPDSGVLPDCTVLTEGQELRVEVTSTGKKMYVMQASVAEGDYSGQYIFENFVIGTDDDPGAMQLETWKKSVGARRLKGLLKAASIPESTSEQQLCIGFGGCKFITQVSQYTEKAGDYAGTVRNRFNFYKVGTRATGGGVSKPKPVVAPAAPAPPTGAPSAPPPPKAPPAPAAPSAPAAGMLPCGNCKQEFPIAEFAAHVQACLAGAV